MQEDSAVASLKTCIPSMHLKLENLHRKTPGGFFGAMAAAIAARARARRTALSSMALVERKGNGFVRLVTEYNKVTKIIVNQIYIYMQATSLSN